MTMEMPPAARRGESPSPSPLSPSDRAAAVDRLCRHLAHGDHSAVVDPFSPHRLRLVGRRNGVSRVEGAMPAEVAAAAITADLAVWRPGTGDRAHLVATPAGRARAARLNAPLAFDSFQAQHACLRPAVIGSGERSERVIRNEAESPLAWLRSRQGRTGEAFIDEAGFAAGDRLRADLERARMLPRVTADWSRAGASGRRGPAGPAAANDAVLAARQRVGRALDAVGGDFAGLLIDVCGFLKGLSAVEGERGWPARSAKVVLQLALRRLAAHYGLASEARGPAASVQSRAWSAPDARPEL